MRVTMNSGLPPELVSALLAAIGGAPVVDLCYEALTAPCENEALRSEHSPTGAPKRRGRKRRSLRLACFLVTARPWLRSFSHLPHLRLCMGGTMIRITTSLAAIFLLSQVTLGHAQSEPRIPFPPAEQNEPVTPTEPGLTQEREPLDTSSPRLDSLLKECRGNNRNTPVPGWFLHCNGEPATRLFQMFGNAPFNIPAIEKTYNGRRYLERWLKSPDREIGCWERVEVSGDPVVIAFYDCILIRDSR